MSFNIIVARYNENVEWTEELPNVIIYNKGNELDDSGSYKEVRLNNVGREGHTYYKYISDNYENLAEHTIFLQGIPFDHSPNIISNLREYIDNSEMNVDFRFLSEDIHYSSIDLECRRHWQCRNIHKTWERVFGKKIEDQECVFGPGAQFIVSKTQILKNSKEFYENIVRILEYAIDPLEGYDIERFHKYIFK